MKLKRLIPFLLLVPLLSAQQQSKDTPPPQYIYASGNAATFPNPTGSGTVTFLYSLPSGLTGVSITAQGCAQDGITCTNLTPVTGANPYTGTTSAQTQFTGGFFQYIITATYTGSGTITVSMVGIQAKLGSGSGGATTFNQVGSGTNTGQNLVVGNGSALTPTGTGIINANEINGAPVTGTVNQGVRFSGTNTLGPSSCVTDTNIAYGVSCPMTESANGATSMPALLISGNPFTGGTGTTTFPLSYINTSGATAPTSLSTSGTMFGINAPSGFAGNLLHLFGNGASLVRIDSGGNYSSAANISATGNISTSAGSIGASSGSVSGVHFISLGTVPTVAFGTGAGTSPAATTITGHDGDFTVTFTAGTSPAASAAVFTVTFNTTFTNPASCVFAQGSAASATAITAVYKTTTATTFVLNSTTTALTAGQVYTYTATCHGV
jgi:hypothetical protein